MKTSLENKLKSEFKIFRMTFSKNSKNQKLPQKPQNSKIFQKGRRENLKIWLNNF